MTLLVQYVSQRPIDDFGLPFATLKFSATLAATTDTLLTVPGDAKFYKAVIKSSAEVSVALNKAASAPAGASFAITDSDAVGQFYPLCREVKSGDVLHFFSSTTADVFVLLYALNTPT